MMMYNADFLIAAVVILLLVLRNFLDQKRAEDLNSRIFLFFAVIGILDVIAQLLYNFRRWGFWPGGSGDHNYFLSVSGIASIYTSLLYYDIAR